MIRVVETFFPVCVGFLCACTGQESVRSGGEVAAADSIVVYVDPTVEMVSTVYRLADLPPFNTQVLPSYIDEIEEYFRPFRDHRAVGVIRDLWRNHGINGSAPMALAVYLTWPSLAGKVPIPPLPGDLDSRWTPETVSAFRDALRAFAEDTRYAEFYASQEDYFDRSVLNLRTCLEDHPIIPWLKDYFGQEPEHYVIVVGMQIGNGNYGLSTTLQDGSKEFISVIGATSPSRFRKIPQFSRWSFVPTVVHEFAHSFVNPVVDSNEDLLRDVTERLYPYHRERLSPQGYLTWRTLSYEYLVRATVIRYLENQGSLRDARRRVGVDEGQGFTGITLLSEAFEEYESNRELYPTLDAFIPRVVECFEEILLELEESSRS